MSEKPTDGLDWLLSHAYHDGDTVGYAAFMSGAQSMLAFATRHPELVRPLRDEVWDFWAESVVPHSREFHGVSAEPLEIIEREFNDAIDELADLVRKGHPR